MRVEQQRWLEGEVERLTAENQELCEELRRVRGSSGTRVDQILSPAELAELIEDCRRPPRPRGVAKARVEAHPEAGS